MFEKQITRLRYHCEVVAREKDEFKPGRSWEEEKLDTVILKAYQEFRRMIDQSCGKKEVLTVSIPVDTHMIIGEHNIHEWVKQLEEKSGLKVSPITRSSIVAIALTSVELSLTNDPKCCGIFTTAYEFKTLDFSQFLIKNLANLALWTKFKTELAKQMVKAIQENLKSKPYLYLGIKQRVPIVKHAQSNAAFFIDEASTSIFDGSFNFHDKEVKFSNLEIWQVEELAVEINRLIAGGNVEIEKSPEVLLVSLLYAPKKPPVENPVFDYQKFYEFHNQDSFELQKLFLLIISGLEFPSAEEQFLHLSPRRILTYRFKPTNQPNFTELKDSLIGSPHEEDFRKAIMACFPKIKIKEIKFKSKTINWETSDHNGQHGTSSENQRIEIEFGYDFDYYNHQMLYQPGNGKLIRQLEIEKNIAYIKKHKIQYIGNQITKKLLKYLLKNPLSESSHDFCKTSLEESLFDVTLDKPKNVKFNLLKVADPKLQRTIVNYVQKVSFGTIELDLKKLEAILYY